MADQKKEPAEVKATAEDGIGVAPLTREEADAQMERFFAALEKEYRDVPDAEIERGARKVQAFVDGHLTWADLFNFTPEMLFQMAEFGFTQFRMGRYPDAERVFKVLTVLDWNNPYYHSVMGSILQRQQRYGEAIAEYTQAIELDDADIVSHTNRGEVFLRHGLLDEAEADFMRAVACDIEENDRFANRARMLLKEVARRRGKPAPAPSKGKKQGGKTAGRKR